MTRSAWLAASLACLAVAAPPQASLAAEGAAPKPVIVRDADQIQPFTASGQILDAELECNPGQCTLPLNVTPFGPAASAGAHLQVTYASVIFGSDGPAEAYVTSGCQQNFLSLGRFAVIPGLTAASFVAGSSFSQFEAGGSITFFVDPGMVPCVVVNGKLAGPVSASVSGYYINFP